MIKSELKGINQDFMRPTLKGTKKSLMEVVHREDTRALLMEHLPGSLTKEEIIIIKELLHLFLPLVALKFKKPRSCQRKT